MKNQQIVNQIILQLNQINVDGETMESIIEQVGMSDQMLRQLVMKCDNVLVRDLTEEKVNLLSQLT